MLGSGRDVGLVRDLAVEVPVGDDGRVYTPPSTTGPETLFGSDKTSSFFVHLVPPQTSL